LCPPHPAQAKPKPLAGAIIPPHRVA